MYKNCIRPLSNLLSAVVLLLLCACAHNATNLTMTTGTVENWNGLIDEVEIVQPFNLNGYTGIIVSNLDTEATPLPKSDENTFEPVTTVLKSSSAIFTGGFRNVIKAGSPIQVMTASDSGADVSTLMVKGKITKMDPGSQALRYFVSFGAGKTTVEIVGEVIDTKSNKTLVKFKHARGSGIGLFGGSYEKFLTDNVNDVGADVGKMLLLFAKSN